MQITNIGGGSLYANYNGSPSCYSIIVLNVNNDEKIDVGAVSHPFHCLYACDHFKNCIAKISPGIPCKRYFTFQPAERSMKIDKTEKLSLKEKQIK